MYAHAREITSQYAFCGAKVQCFFHMTKKKGQKLEKKLYILLFPTNFQSTVRVRPESNQSPTKRAGDF